MTSTLPGADIRGYYTALEIPIPEWATGNASVRCFANPDAHRHDDHHPSVSVDLISGAFLCHGCGAHGGAFDAALTQGYTSRSAIDLMIDHGLANRRSRLCTARELLDRPPHQGVRTPACRPALQATDADVRRWQRALTHRPNLALRLGRDRGWTLSAMRELGLGWDRGRITIPIHDQHDTLTGVLRYQPYNTGRPKMLAIAGTRLGLIPAPTAEPAEQVFLVEGPSDMIAARSRGIPAIAVPGDHAWRADWAQHLSGRAITIIMDCDQPGRGAAARIYHDLQGVADVEVRDLAPDRDDGWDLTDWLTTHPTDTDWLAHQVRS